MIKTLYKLIADYKFFFYLYGLFISVVGIALLVYSKEESFFIVNGIYSTFGDVFFKVVTHLGDGLFFVLIVLALALYRYRLALLGLIVFVASSVIAQVLKVTLFDKAKRPVAYFEHNIDIHFVEGVTRHVKNSFPSGHTTTAFALALFLVLAFELRKSGWAMAIIAILVGYSRVYLAVHFPVDVYFGSLIGVLTATFMYAWLNTPFKNKFGDKGLMSKK